MRPLFKFDRLEMSRAIKDGTPDPMGRLVLNGRIMKGCAQAEVDLIQLLEGVHQCLGGEVIAGVAQSVGEK